MVGKTWYRCFALFILLIPLNNLYEVKAMLDGSLPYNGWSLQLTPSYIKIYKDLFTLFFFAVTISFILKFKNVRVILKQKKIIPLYFFLGMILLTSIITFCIGEPFDAIVGLRGFSSILYFFLGVSVSSFINMNKISRYLLIILILQILFQIYQFVNKSGLPVFGELRSPGVFIVPAAAGLFANLTAYYFVLSKDKKFIPFSFLSVLLSNSTAGILAMFVGLGYLWISRISKNNSIIKLYALLSIFPLIVFFLFVNLTLISNRGDGISTTILSRIFIMEKYFSSMGLFEIMFGGKFGQATAFAVLDNSSSSFIADNTFLVAFVSMGFFAFIALFLFIARFVILDKDKFLSISMFAYALTANIFDLSPVSQIMFLIAGVVWGRASFINPSNENYKY